MAGRDRPERPEQAHAERVGEDRARRANRRAKSLDIEVRRPTSAPAANLAFRAESIEVKRRLEWPEKDVSAVAARQYALITREQLFSLGAGRDAIRRAVERGRLCRLHRAVYATTAPSALPPLAIELAAVLACGSRAYLSHHSAAHVWGFRVAPRDGVDVTVVARRPPTRNGIHIRRVADIDPADVRSHRGIPITSPARTLLDIAVDLTEREFERAFDEAIVRRVTSLAAVRAMLLVNGRRRGAQRIRALVSADRATTMTRSDAEEMFLGLVRDAKLPGPEINARIGRYEVDFCWRQERVVVEIDGHAFHSTRAALERDHGRDAELQQLGFIVIRVTWRQLRREPLRVVAWVASALSRRAA